MSLQEIITVQMNGVFKLAWRSKKKQYLLDNAMSSQEIITSHELIYLNLDFHGKVKGIALYNYWENYFFVIFNIFAQFSGHPLDMGG